MNDGAEKSFSLYDDEFGFIKDYFTKYREVPPVDVFTDKFPDFDVYNTDGSIDHYIVELHQHRARAELQSMLLDGGSSLKDLGPYATIQKLQQKLSVLSKDTRQTRDIDLAANSGDRLESLRERLELLASGKSIIGIPSGVEVIDSHFGGWQKGDFIVIAGWTGSMKSFLSLLFAQNAWVDGYRVLFISLEMSEEQVGYRFDTMLSGRTDGGITNSALTHGVGITYDKYKNWLGDVYEDKHPFVVVTNADLDQVDQNTVQAKIEHWHPDLVVLDYHQLFDEASGITGETEKAKQLSKAFKRLALKTGTPIIDITGVTMPDGHGQRPPELSELAWTKQLAYDSDLTLAVCMHEEEDGTNTLEVVSRKVRRGRHFRFFLNWDIDRGIINERKRRFVFDTEEEDQDGED